MYRPILEQASKEMGGTRLWVPAAPDEEPDQAHIKVRFKEFSGQVTN